MEGLTFCPGPNMIDVSFPKDSASGNSQHSVLTPVITIYLLLIYPIFQFVIRWLVHFYRLTPHNWGGTRLSCRDIPHSLAPLHHQYSDQIYMLHWRMMHIHLANLCATPFFL